MVLILARVLFAKFTCTDVYLIIVEVNNIFVYDPFSKQSIVFVRIFPGLRLDRLVSELSVLHIFIETLVRTYTQKYASTVTIASCNAVQFTYTIGIPEPSGWFSTDTGDECWATFTRNRVQMLGI